VAVTLQNSRDVDAKGAALGEQEVEAIIHSMAGTITREDF